MHEGHTRNNYAAAKKINYLCKLYYVTKFSENRAENGQNAVNIVKYLGCGIIIATKDGEKSSSVGVRRC